MTDLVRVTDVPRLPPRPRDAHKGQFGYVLAVGGSRGMAGAMVLAARSAIRSGAGKVTAAVPEGLYPIVASHLVVCTTEPLPEGPGGVLAPESADRVVDLSADFHVVALGPGLGRAAGLVRLTADLLERVTLPMVVDADGLNCLAETVEVLHERPAPTVLTPHPKEMARLTGRGTGKVQAEREATAAEFARRWGVVVVLKGAGTVVTDGHRIYVNTTGNPGMATGGSGDVLTGAIAGLVAQGLEPFDAAVLGVYIHGLAGDLAREELGEAGMIATDILERLPAALERVSALPTEE